MAYLKSPSVRGDTHMALTLDAPADSPAMVIASGSPPKASMLLYTHLSAAI